jgi:Uma2 family endonuclease
MSSMQTLSTTEQLEAMPDDGTDRELILGRLRERPTTYHTRRHARTTTNLSNLLAHWLDKQTGRRGELLAGGASFQLRHDPDTAVGMDLAYISAELASASPDNASLIDGPPVLAVEVLSPSDKHEEIVEKIEEYLDCGVAVVWVVDPDLRTVTVHRPGAEPELFNIHQELSGEPELPGFRVPVADVFGR